MHSSICPCCQHTRVARQPLYHCCSHILDCISLYSGPQKLQSGLLSQLPLTDSCIYCICAQPNVSFQYLGTTQQLNFKILIQAQIRITSTGTTKAKPFSREIPIAVALCAISHTTFPKLFSTHGYHQSWRDLSTILKVRRRLCFIASIARYHQAPWQLGICMQTTISTVLQGLQCLRKLLCVQCVKFMMLVSLYYEPL